MSARFRESNFMARLRRPEWFALAKCRGTSPTIFHPGRGEPVEPAKAICATCPVAAECLDYALTNKLHEGIYGGLCARERARLRKAQKAS